jgi:hypothetical protein
MSGLLHLFANQAKQVSVHSPDQPRRGLAISERAKGHDILVIGLLRVQDIAPEGRSPIDIVLVKLVLGYRK